MFWPLGGPNMIRVFIAAGCLGIIFAQIPWPWLKRVAALTLTGMVTFAFVLMSFNLDTSSTSALPFFLTEAKWYASGDYLVIAALVVVGLYLAFNHAPTVPRFGKLWQWGLAALIVTSLARFDYFASEAAHGNISAAPDPAFAFHSAVGDSGLVPSTGPRHNVIVILAESLGIPEFAQGQAMFAADWDRHEWRSRYDVSHGKVDYFGSTTFGELREICGKFGNYASFDFRKADCLPGRMRKAGYQATAIHAFAANFFERDEWWPQLKFNKELFGDQLENAGAKACGGIFPGACDVDIPRQIGAMIKQSPKPQFVYWVTLNSHLPVLPDASLGTESCDDANAPLADVSPRLCRLFVVHHNLSQAISKMAMDPALPPTDILIVGDHMPPYFDRQLRAMFNPAQVPWILLRARDAGSALSQYRIASR
ncbi:MAG: sulfatase-like hydrolase/transferase [Novosphingobium sp.]